MIAASHPHSPYGRALATLGEKLEPITRDVCAFYGDGHVLLRRSRHTGELAFYRC